MSWIGAAAQGVGTTINAFAGAKQASDQNKKIKNALRDYPYNPYAGARPPQVDFNDPNAGGYLAGNFPASMQAMIQGPNGQGANSFRPVQTLYTGEVANRSQGNDIGYDPSWMSESAKVLQNNSDRALTDQLKNSAGMLSAKGLSGNPKAYQNTSGIIQRDNATDLQNSLMGLDIQNMQEKANEKQAYTGMLGGLNNQNFNQEDQVANFDLNAWKAEESAKEARTGIGLDAAGMYRNPYSVAGSMFGNSLVNAGSSMMGGGGVSGGSSSASALGSSGASNNFQGYGLQPTSASALNSSYQNYLSSGQGRKNFTV